MKRFLCGVLVLVAGVVATVGAAHAQVGVNIGIQLPGPPTFVPVPQAPVYYAPGAPANMFFYGDQYWVFANDAWYVGPNWTGPWALVAPVYIPAPILRVPVRYFRAAPVAWRHWNRQAPPRWQRSYGRDWREHGRERAWREREERWEHGRGRGRS